MQRNPRPLGAWLLTVAAVGALTTLMPVRLDAATPEKRAENGSQADDPIAAARQTLAQSPADAEAHLALARALGESIDADPANGPRFAFEMLTALEQAVELDPALTEAYHWLVGYYLNAPAIAGGSLEAAEAIALRLGEFDPDGSQMLLEQIAANRSGAE